MGYLQGTCHLSYRDQPQRPGRRPRPPIPGSQTGSQRRQSSGDIRRQPAMVCAARWPIRPHPATCSDGADAPEKRRSECLLILSMQTGNGGRSCRARSEQPTAGTSASQCQVSMGPGLLDLADSCAVAPRGHGAGQAPFWAGCHCARSPPQADRASHARVLGHLLVQRGLQDRLSEFFEQPFGSVSDGPLLPGCACQLLSQLLLGVGCGLSFFMRVMPSSAAVITAPPAAHQARCDRAGDTQPPRIPREGPTAELSRPIPRNRWLPYCVFANS